MTYGTKRMAAAVAVTVLVVVALGLSTGSVAFSQAGHAVNSTLAWLRQMVVGPTPGEPAVAPPAPRPVGDETPGRAVTYSTGLCLVRADETGIWQTLKDQGIELVAVSTDPEVYFATLTRVQAESSLDVVRTLRHLSSPRVTVSAGDMATIALTQDDPQKGRRGFALGLLPVVSGGGREVQSTISFHDGHSGFEIPNAATESGGVVLIRVKGIFLPEEQEAEGPLEFLIRIQVDLD